MFARQQVAVDTARPARTRVPGARVVLAGLLIGCAALFAYLLRRFPYDGLYGQDAYAYYYQALALWQQLTGTPPAPNQLFGPDGLYHWPIGYHLQLMLGLLAGAGPGGGRALTLILAVGAPGVVYLLTGRLWPQAAAPVRAGAGLIAGLVLVLTGIYARMGLSLMSDVPTLFWSTLACYCGLRAWPPDAGAPARGRAPQLAWPIGAGGALGLAVLTRYSAGLLLGPLLLYGVLRGTAAQRPAIRTGVPDRALWWAAGAFLAALVPQAAYALTHPVGAAYADWLAGWNLGNLWSGTLTGADGSTTVLQPNVAFYVLSPLVDSAAGFLSWGTLPALILGLGVLVRQRQWPALGLLVTWWLLPALFFAGTPYQAHRFVLAYLPALAVPIGIGAATAAAALVRGLRHSCGARRGAATLAAGLIWLGLAGGLWQDQQAVRSWAATQATWQAQEQQVVTLARRAAGGATLGAPPRAVTFAITAALYHYTGWPLLELFTHDEAAIARFLAAPGPRLVVLPTSQLATQWAGTPLAARWQWLAQHYTLRPQGTSGPYTVYTVADPP